MNSKFKLYGAAFLVAALSVSLLYVYPNFPKQCKFYGRYYFEKVTSIFCKYEDVEINAEEKPVDAQKSVEEKLFTAEELKKYDGSPESLGLYVALLGKVYDVEKGAQHYKPGGGYSFFSGKDASKAYITGDFTEEGLIDDISGLEDDAIAGLVQWQGFYDKEYVYVGKVTGHYYDQSGDPTEAMREVDEAVKRSNEAKRKLEDEKQLFPPCNSEWEHDKGGRVWCTENSGGVERTWVGVPRKYYRPGDTTPSCVCVRTKGSPSVSVDGSEDSDRGDLDNPNFKEYDDCPAHAESCKIK